MLIAVKVGVCNVNHDRSPSMQCRLWSKSLCAMLTAVELGVYNVDHSRCRYMQFRPWSKSGNAKLKLKCSQTMVMQCRPRSKFGYQMLIAIEFGVFNVD